eukprot:407595-Rhodomonas_salina.1
MEWEVDARSEGRNGELRWWVQRDGTLELRREPRGWRGRAPRLRSHARLRRVLLRGAAAARVRYARRCAQA